jgi:putative addiction module component (TIGR02574 family)
MSEAASAVFAEALKLTPAERGELIDRLADTRDPPAGLEELTETEFAAEVSRRAAELRADPSAGSPWERVKEV